MNTYQDFLQPSPEFQHHSVNSSSINNNINSDNNLSSTVVPLKRTRAKRSCDFCRKRKSRCDADSTLPCSNCKAWGYSCEFQTVRKKRGPPSVYVDNLEKKCKKMESLLTALTKCSAKDLERNNYEYAGHTRPASPPSFHTDSSSDDEDDSDFDACNLGQRDAIIKDYDSIRYTGQSSAGLRLFDNEIFEPNSSIPWPGKDNIILKLMSQDELMIVRTEKSLTTGRSDVLLDIGLSMHTSVHNNNILQTSSITTSTSINFKEPVKDQLDKMIDIYFSHIHFLLPIINKTKFLDQYHHSSTGQPSVLTQAVLALSFRFSCHNFPGLVTEASEFGKMYFRKVMKRLRDSTRSRLCHVQAALLLTLYLDMDEGDVESTQWRTLGNAIRMAQDLGLHRSCAKWNLPRSEIEIRHRVFYACYVMDRWLGARAGKPLTILDRDFDTDMPLPYEVTDDEDNSDLDQSYPVYRSFIHLIKLSEILGRILKSLYAPKAKSANANAGIDDPTILTVFDRRLHAWKNSLEEPLYGIYLSDLDKANLNMFYYTTVLLLRRPFINLPSTTYPELQSIVTESENICMDAAHQLSNIIQQRDSQTKNPAYFYLLCAPSCFVYSLFQSSLVYLSSALKTRRNTDIQALHQSINLIKSNSVGPAPRAIEILNMLVAINSLHADSNINHLYTSLKNGEHDKSIPTTSSDISSMYDEKNIFNILDLEDEVPKVEFFQRKMMNTSIIGGIEPEVQQTDLITKAPYIQHQQHIYQHQQQQKQRRMQYPGIQEQTENASKCLESSHPSASISSFTQRQYYSSHNKSQHHQSSSHHRSFSMGQMNSSHQHMYSHHTRSISHDNVASMVTPSFGLQSSTNNTSPTPLNAGANMNHMLTHSFPNQYNESIQQQQQQQQQRILNSYTPTLPQAPQAYTAAYDPNISVSNSTLPPSSLNWSDWDVYIGHQNNHQQQTRSSSPQNIRYT